MDLVRSLSKNLSISLCGGANQDVFHEAMGMVEVKDPKNVNPGAHSIKMPPLNQPRWFKDAVTDLKSSCPPSVGPQVSRTIFFIL